MSGAPETGYAKSGDLHIAYRVTGSAGRDAVFVPNRLTDVESMVEQPIGIGPGQP